MLDGHKSHECSLATLQYAKENLIPTLTLPPHRLQPLDRSVFGPMKKEVGPCNEHVDVESSHLCRGNVFFGQLFPKTWESAASIRNAVNGFRGCGLYPIDRGGVMDDEAAFIPAMTLERAEIDAAEQTPDAEIDQEQLRDWSGAPSRCKDWSGTA